MDQRYEMNKLNGSMPSILLIMFVPAFAMVLMMLSIRLKKWKVSSKYLLFSFYLYLQLFADDYNKSTLIKKYGSNNIFKSPRSC